MPIPTIAAAPTTAPTPIPAFVPVLSPDEGGGDSDVLVSLGSREDVAGEAVPGRFDGVNGTPIRLAREVAYATGNFERSVTSHPILIASA